MRSKETLLRLVGQQIRSARVAADLTQDDLGKRAGIVGKYVSEIERGTRDLPISTLHALVERGLGLRLEIGVAKNGNGHRADLEEVIRLLSALSPDKRARMLSLMKALADLVAT